MRLATLLLWRGGYQEAIHLAQSVLTLDRYWEEAYRIMMLSHALRGNRPMALRIFERAREALREGLDLEPMADTVALVQAIARGDPLDALLPP
jgi:DNA-binding SARP family transcriptional activator